uniref:SWIM-type domain-containing protein n=1 Tax=Lactuca sativa TaxID=4236 RepID=A0A9R1XHA9_LACSA|nr:hypothetical protein LSAT_V11C400190060 [Lactuca sativa]
MKTLNHIICYNIITGNIVCDARLNNMCGVFNSKIIDAREKLIIICLEFIREYLMKRIISVVDRWLDQCVAYLIDKTCSYGKREVCSITCKHAVNALCDTIQNHEDFVHNRYKLST